MTFLVVGLSHRTATVDLIERASIAAAELPAVLADLIRSEHVVEAMVLSTCNRVELYAEVDKFHGGVNNLSDALAVRAGTHVAGLGGHLYVHYEDAAVQHLFTVASGLDSMVLGETQILGQVRTAYAAAQVAGTAGRALHDLTQQALRVGKRAHSATGFDAAGASLVSAGLAEAERLGGSLAGQSALVCGAGSMAALAVTTLRRAGVEDIVIANRTPERARLLASTVAGRNIGLDNLGPTLSSVDIVVSSTAATGVVVPVDVLERAVKRREGRPLLVLDLALPRDVDPLAGAIDGVTVIDLEALSAVLADAEVHASASAGAGAMVEAARLIVAAEVRNFLAARRSGEVAPTVTALRSRAAAVVDAELVRLAGRLPAMDGVTRAEVESTVRRVVATLLHTPTVRVKELATVPGGDTYAQALRELFELNPAATEVVAKVALPVGPASTGPLPTSQDAP